MPSINSCQIITVTIGKSVHLWKPFRQRLTLTLSSRVNALPSIFWQQPLDCNNNIIFPVKFLFFRTDVEQKSVCDIGLTMGSRLRDYLYINVYRCLRSRNRESDWTRLGWFSRKMPKMAQPDPRFLLHRQRWTYKYKPWSGQCHQRKEHANYTILSYVQFSWRLLLWNDLTNYVCLKRMQNIRIICWDRLQCFVFL